MEKRGIGIRLKVTLLICFTSLTVACAGIASGYFFGFRLMRDTIGADHVRMARNLAVVTSNILDGNIRDIIIHMTDPVHGDDILESALKYKNKDAVAINKYLLDMDKKWVKAEAGDPLIMEHLRGKSAERLKRYTLLDKTISEIFITDKFGGLVAASDKTSDFYQADEAWWQEAYNGGSGDIYVGNVEYDESAGVIAITIAVPVKDEKGEVIGVCKAVLDTGVLFGPIGDFTIGRTGHAVLVNNEGFIIFHSGVKPLSTKACSDKEFESLVNSPKGWQILKEPHVHKGKDMFLALAVIEYPLLLKNGIIWRVFVDEEAREVLSPLNKLFAQMGIVTAIMLLFLIPVSFVFGGVFVNPIKKLHEVTEHMEEGRLDYPVEIKTGDEIEQLADSFRNMVSRISFTEKELRELNETLEKRIKEKTRGLKESQEATLHLLEDLQVSKDELEEKTKSLDESLRKATKSREMMVSMLDDNNKIRMELEKKLTELKSTQGMLVQSEKLASLGKLVSDMAHEVNNPLMVISGRAQLSLMEDIKNKEIVENLKIVKGECMRAKEIIQRLLMFSKPSKGELAEVDVNKAIEFVVKLLEHQFSLANIKIVRHYSEDIPPVEVDEKQMHEVFMNLLKNSSEAMPEGGSITVTTSKESDNVRMDFTDTGEGISEQDLQKIFDPFFTTKESGTGLGLSVCYGIVGGHGGGLKYTSKPGEGTTATILLPIAKKGEGS